MPTGWQSKLARVSRMDWAEARVRMEQEFHKQSDLLMHRIGVRRDSISLSLDPTPPPAQFFFSGKASERAELLRQHLPAAASAILHEADEIYAHRFQLLGYKNLDFTLNRSRTNSKDADSSWGDKEIDWHLDSIHNKRTPMEPWFKIPFLDFAAAGDHKVTWELNRHQHLVTLAKARLLSGDEKYTRELLAQWRSWSQANPYPMGINWGSTLEVAFRSLSWIWVDQLLAGDDNCARFRAELFSEVAPALAFQGRYIERFLSTYFSPNTHLLGEALALFFLGSLYPWMPRASQWKGRGWQIMLREAERQVRPDGVYFEQSLHYHVYALDFFLYARLLAARSGMAIPPSYDAILQRMLDVVAALAQAGLAEGFGDDDGGRLWNPRRNRTEHMTDPLALGAATYARNFAAAQLTEEAIWLFGAPAVDALSQPQPAPQAHSVAFRDSGFYVLANPEPYPQTMVLDAGPQGIGRSGHGHADALSLRLTMNGQRWLVDSGTGVYISADPADRNKFRGTAAHNTLRVDGLDQAVPDGPFSWTHLPTTQVETWIAGKTFTYFVANHNGYARLPDPVLHRRHVLNIKTTDGLWLVRDVAVGKAEHELEINWHLAPDLQAKLETNNIGSGRVEISKAGDESANSTLTLLVPEQSVWQTALEVTKTQISPAYGALESAPLLRSRVRALLPTETATALVPGRIVIHPEGDHRDTPRIESFSQAILAGATLTSAAQSAVQVYELNSSGDHQSFLFALNRGQWSYGPWSSDAQMLYCRFENGRLTHLVVIGWTHVSWRGQPLLQAESSEFFEWHRRDGIMNATPRTFSATSLFHELTNPDRNRTSPCVEKI
jgi:hypothetical protein